jgi:hypothetical protein
MVISQPSASKLGKRGITLSQHICREDADFRINIGVLGYSYSGNKATHSNLSVATARPRITAQYNLRLTQIMNSIFSL